MTYNFLTNNGRASKFSEIVANRNILKITKFQLHCIYRKKNKKSNLPASWLRTTQ